MNETAARAKAKRLTIRFTPGPEPEPDADPLVTAANPRPAWLLAAREPRGPELGPWEVWHPLDLLSDDAIKLMSIERELAGSTGEQYMGRIRDQVQLLVPDLPDDIFGRLSGHQLFAIGVKAWQRPGETPPEKTERQADAANPPAGERASASSSRSPLAASDGAIAR